MAEPRYPACYIRESMGDDTDDAREGQRSDCRQLATRDKIDPGHLVEFDDWSRSGSEKARRPAQDRLMADMRARRVSVVYTRSLDRLMRSTRKLADFLDVARESGTRIVTLREGEVKDDNPSAWMFVQTIMTAAEYESRVGKARARSAVETKRRNNTRIGQAPYGDLPGEDWRKVVAAFKAERTYHGAARRLNDPADKFHAKSRRAHLSTAQGVALGWEASTVKRVIKRRAPELLPPPAKGRTRYRAATHLLSRLVICPADGSLMTTIPHKDGRAPSYACRIGHRSKDHPRPWVISENAILPAVKAAVGLIGGGVVRLAAADPEETAVALADLRAKRAQIEATAEYMPADAVKAALAKIDEQLANFRTVERTSWSLAAGELGLYGSAVNWDAPTAEVNAKLRELWTGIRLEYAAVPEGEVVKGRHHRDKTLKPIGAYWRVPPVEATDEIDESGTAVDRPMGERQPDGTWYVPFEQ